MKRNNTRSSSTRPSTGCSRRGTAATWASYWPILAFSLSLAGCQCLGLGAATTPEVKLLAGDRVPYAVKKGAPAPIDGVLLSPALFQSMRDCLSERVREHEDIDAVPNR